MTAFLPFDQSHQSDRRKKQKNNVTWPWEVGTYNVKMALWNPGC